MKFVFVTGNIKKVKYLEKFLGKKVEHYNLDLDEIQSLDPAEVVKHKAKEAYKVLKKAVLIEDTTLSFNALGRLPGTLIKFFLQEIGNDGLCTMLKKYEDRHAVGGVTYGLYDGKKFLVFSATTKGIIANKPCGARGHGWDPIFMPEGSNLTFGEMSEQEYASYSMRNKAVKKLAEYLSNNL